MDNKSFAIGTLSITAAILLVGLVMMSQLPGPQPALGSGQIASGGDYILLSGQLQESTELVYLIDTAVERLNVYAYDPNRGGLNLIQSINLKQLPTQRSKRSRRP